MEELSPQCHLSEWGELLPLGCPEPPSHNQQSSGQVLPKNVGLKA